MALSSQTKTLLSVCACLILIYFLWNQMSTPVKNEGNLVTDSENILPLSDEEHDKIVEYSEEARSAGGKMKTPPILLIP